ncbi:hypothetical protein CEXT_94641 [Caerostris extrusa]|uniref:Uncharacterized protein n=1 Tax=Caerostris extrusa TaxID=172846 RepID=A0AAV4NUE8_CAEEX|nr:hypothetical protein CEXT_94641 [Caerostris extrusa]
MRELRSYSEELESRGGPLIFAFSHWRRAGIISRKRIDRWFIRDTIRIELSLSPSRPALVLAPLVAAGAYFQIV